MRWLVFFALLWAFPAQAENKTCPTRPNTDNSNACASTAFVKNNIAATNEIPVTNYGFKGDGVTDNGPLVAGLMSALGPNPGDPVTGTVSFPGTPGSETDYYFSQAFSVTRSGGNFTCGNGGVPRLGGTVLVFAAGVDGVVWENFETGGIGGGEIHGCKIVSLGFGRAADTTNGSPNLTGISMPGSSNITAPLPANGDGLIVKGFFHTDTPLAVPTGTYVVSGGGTSSVVLSNNATTTTAGNGTAIWRLPAALGVTANIVSGSNTITVTSGTTCFQPGDWIWAPGFPFGSTVLNVAGACGAQTMHMVKAINTGGSPQTATGTFTGAKIWRVPAAERKRTTANAQDDYYYGFPFGQSMACAVAAGTIYSPNCTLSVDNNISVEAAIIGRMESGNNTASYLNSFTGIRNWIDYAAYTQVGTTVVNLNAQSGESGTAEYVVVKDCSNQNTAMIFGGYLAFNGGCIDPADAYNNPIDGTHGFMSFGNTANGDTGGTVFYSSNSGSLRIKGSTVFSTTGADPCFNFAPQTGNGDALTFSKDCGTAYSWALKYNGAAHAWDLQNIYWGAPAIRFTDRDYPSRSDVAGGMIFSTGFAMDGSNIAGAEKYWQNGSQTTFPATAHQGDLQWNAAPTAGGTIGVADIAAGNNARPFGPIANDAAGTQWTLPYIVHTPVAIASLPTCNAANNGMVATLSNGTAYGVGTYGSAVGAAGAVTRFVLCTNTGGAGVYAWAYN